ncbi:hypothetical protein BASA81_004946 [Batrachochytrium salamandrivorans]|nr:hypothetical protein BASA81_004946 [Batrachochytrium salamandrivorans]
MFALAQRHYYDYGVDMLVDRTASKLHLLWDQVSTREAPHCMHPNDLPEDLLGLVCEFLCVRDLGNLRQTCPSLRSLLDPNHPEFAPLFYSRHWSEFGCNTHDTYLTARLDWTRHELAHFSHLMPLISAVQLVDRSVEISGNVGRFPTKEIALAVSKRRPQALGGVLIPDVAIATRFRRQIQNHTRAVNFMITSPPDSTLASRPPIMAEGFVGYALDLLELRAHEEWLRETVLSALVYRDLTVWERYEDMINAIEAGEYDSAQPFFCVLYDTREWNVQRNELDAMVYTASWQRFRPSLQTMLSPQRYMDSLLRSIAALEAALVVSV